MKVDMDPFTKKRVIDAIKDPDPKKLFMELAQEFGRRWGMAVAQGIPHSVAFEACKHNFEETGKAMIELSKYITLEMVGKTKEDILGEKENAQDDGGME